jgi:hypothetical protein
MLRGRRGRRPEPEQRQPTGVVAIADIPERAQVMICGQVVRMRARPAAHLPVLAVTLDDQSGSVTVVWTGRREIGGVKLGRWMYVSGTPIRRGDRFEFTNPRYTLLKSAP